MASQVELLGENFLVVSLNLISGVMVLRHDVIILKLLERLVPKLVKII